MKPLKRAYFIIFIAILVLVIFFIMAGKVQAADRYWVGNGGNWGDTAHWSTVSGGAGGGSIPNADADVVFDANSFTGTGQSIFFPESITDNSLILNFAGEDGATVWTEEANGLNPLISHDCEIDSNTLKMSSLGRLVYMPPAMEADFNLQFSFSFDPIVGTVNGQFGAGLQDLDGDAIITVGLGELGSDEYLAVNIVDRAGNIVAEEGISNFLLPNTEYQAEISVIGRNIVFSIDGDVIRSYTAIIDEPLLGVDLWGAQNYILSDGWIDDVILTNSTSKNYSKSWDMTDLAYPIIMNSVDGVNYWELSIADGTVNASSTTLINSHAIGGATFNALTSNGNVDGGGNSGWDFGAPATYTVTFDSNGGASTPDPITGVAYNFTVELPTAPTKALNTFAGWFKDDETFLIPFTNETPVITDVTVYAKWAETEEASGATANVQNSYIFNTGMGIKKVGNSPPEHDVLMFSVYLIGSAQSETITPIEDENTGIENFSLRVFAGRQIGGLLSFRKTEIAALNRFHRPEFILYNHLAVENKNILRENIAELKMLIRVNNSWSYDNQILNMVFLKKTEGGLENISPQKIVRDENYAIYELNFMGLPEELYIYGQRTVQLKYTSPKTQKNNIIHTLADFINIAKKESLPMTNQQLAKIPVGVVDGMKFTDSDSDGLADNLEKAIKTNFEASDTDQDEYLDSVEVKNNYSPVLAGGAKIKMDKKLAQKLKNRILMQVESRGEIWLMNETGDLRYYIDNNDEGWQVLYELLK